MTCVYRFLKHVQWRKGKDMVMQSALQILAENDVEVSLFDHHHMIGTYSFLLVYAGS